MPTDGSMQPVGELKGRYPRRATAVRSARKMMRYFLTIWDVLEYEDTAELVLSELFTNALKHAKVPADRQIHTRFELSAVALRIEVSDADRENVPLLREADLLDDGGRGLVVVEALAAKWGHEPRACGIGKTTWAVITSACLGDDRD